MIFRVKTIFDCNRDELLSIEIVYDVCCCFFIIAAAVAAAAAAAAAYFFIQGLGRRMRVLFRHTLSRALCNFPLYRGSVQRFLAFQSKKRDQRPFFG